MKTWNKNSISVSITYSFAAFQHAWSYIQFGVLFQRDWSIVLMTFGGILLSVWKWPGIYANCIMKTLDNPLQVSKIHF